MGWRRGWIPVAFAAVLLLLSEAVAAGVANRWEPLAGGRSVAGIRMVDANRGWAVGPGGLVMATRDGGMTWVRQPVPTTEQLAAVAAVDADRVWVAGARGTIFASTDGGASWSDQPTPVDELITGLAFPTPFHGIAVTSDGGFLETFDAGATWRVGWRVNDRLWAIDFYDALHGVVVGNFHSGVVFLTDDGGATWSQTSIALPGGDEDFYSVDMVSPTDVWVGTQFGTVFRTSDGGSSWASALVASQRIVGIAMTPGGTGWISSDYDGAFKTADHGATWTRVLSTDGGTLGAVAAIDQTHAWIGATGASVFRTTDGTNWARHDAGLEWASQRLLAVECTDTAHVWAAGDFGTMVASSDGGLTWRRQASGTGGSLGSIDFVDNLYGWAAETGTASGTTVVVHTVDGGATWVPMPSVPSLVKVVRFVDRNRGFLGTSSGLYATSNGGRTWGAVTTGPNTSVYDIDFPTPLIGYATGGYAVFKTTDGGATWAQLGALGGDDVDFIDGQRGWVAAANGMYRTTDGGVSWARVGDGPDDRGNSSADFQFVDSMRGFATGSFQRTIDGGANWSRIQDTPGGPFLDTRTHAICFVDPAHGWGVGEHGSVFRAPTKEFASISLTVSEPAPARPAHALTLAASVWREPEYFRDGPSYASSLLPTGTVTFRDRGTPIGSVAVGPDGRAILSTTFAPGAHSFSARYEGDAIYGVARSTAVVVELAELPAPPPTTTTTTITTTTTPPPATDESPPPSPAPPSAPRRSGYWMVGRTGDVYAFGDAGWLANAPSSSPTADMEPTATGRGYWVVDSAGRVRAFGDALPLGDAGLLGPGEEVTSLSRTPSGTGYWLFTTKGRVVPRGEAQFLGDMSAARLNGPVLDSIPTPDGRGYFMVASDGGVFAFGTARFRGSMGAVRLNAPVQSLVPDADGVGYWLVASDGGIFSFEARFLGSMGGSRLNRPVTGMVGSPTGGGYLMVGEDGGIFAFGDVVFRGSLGARPPAVPVVSVAAVP